MLIRRCSSIAPPEARRLGQRISERWLRFTGAGHEMHTSHPDKCWPIQYGRPIIGRSNHAITSSHRSRNRSPYWTCCQPWTSRIQHCRKNRAGLNASLANRELAIPEEVTLEERSTRAAEGHEIALIVSRPTQPCHGSAPRCVQWRWLYHRVSSAYERIEHGAGAGCRLHRRVG